MSLMVGKGIGLPPEVFKLVTRSVLYIGPQARMDLTNTSRISSGMVKPPLPLAFVALPRARASRTPRSSGSSSLILPPACT